MARVNKYQNYLTVRKILIIIVAKLKSTLASSTVRIKKNSSRIISVLSDIKHGVSISAQQENNQHVALVVTQSMDIRKS